MPLTDAASKSVWLNVAIFVAAAVVVWFAGVRLTRNLDTLAQRTGMDRAFVGFLLLGGITSLPEVANVGTASLMGNPALGVHNLLGSAAINVLLLAVGDAVIGRRAVTATVVRPSTLMMATLCMLVLIAIAIAVTLGDVQVGGFGLAALAIGALSIGCLRLATGYDARSPWSLDDQDKNETPEEGETDSGLGVRALWLRVAVDAVRRVDHLAVDLAGEGGLGQAGADGGGHLGHRDRAGELALGTVGKRDLDHGLKAFAKNKKARSSAALW